MKRAGESGFSMMEVLVTIAILIFGLLGMAGLQSRATSMEIESYQRAQALVLLQDMADRLSVNKTGPARPTSQPMSARRGRAGLRTPRPSRERTSASGTTSCVGAAEKSGTRRASAR